MDSATANAQQATYWNEVSGPRWVRQQPQFDQMLLEFGAKAMDALHLQPGERVLDVGCGTATSALALAEAVGPSGAVLGCDIARTMIEAARARGDGIAQLSFAVLDAQTDVLSPTGQPFDAAFSRFGVMFFSDPVAAFGNIGAHVRTGGRLAFACWQHEDRNDWISVPARIMRQFTPSPVFPPPNAPGPFAFHDPARVRALLTESGWANVQIESITAPTTIGGGLGVDAALEHTMSTSVAQIMRQQVDDATLEAATAAVRVALAEHLVDGAVIYDGNAWIVTADRSGAARG